MPEDQWDRFEQNAERVTADLGFENAVGVYTATETYTQGEGYTPTYPDTPDQTIDAEWMVPAPDAESERSGTTSDADLILRVDADVGVAWRDYGDSGEAATRVEVLDFPDDPDGDPQLFEVVDVSREPNGLDKLEAMEV